MGWAGLAGWVGWVDNQCPGFENRPKEIRSQPALAVNVDNVEPFNG